MAFSRCCFCGYRRQHDKAIRRSVGGMRVTTAIEANRPARRRPQPGGRRLTAVLLINGDSLSTAIGWRRAPYETALDRAHDFPAASGRPYGRVEVEEMRCTPSHGRRIDLPINAASIS